MTTVIGRVRVNRPYFFTDVNGDRAEFPSFGSGIADLEGKELAFFQMYAKTRQIEAIEPSALAGGQWSVAGGVETFTVTVSVDAGVFIPADPVLYIDLEGTIIAVDYTGPGAYPNAADAGTYDVRIAIGSTSAQGPWSGVKSAVVEAA